MKKLTLILSLTTLVVFSCKKDLLTKQGTENGNKTPIAKNVSELKVSSSFDWNTTRKVNFEFTGKQASPVMVLHEDATILGKGMIVPGQSFRFTAMVPAATKTIQVVFKGKVMTVNAQGTDMKLDLN